MGVRSLLKLKAQVVWYYLGMRRELKIRINDYEEVEKKLLGLGAKFIKQAKARDLYFNQPEGKVLKLTENDEGFFETRLERRGNHFYFTKKQAVSDLASAADRLLKNFTVKKRIVNKQRFFSYKGFLISTNRIDRVGQFLVIESHKYNPTVSFVTNELGIKNPEVVTESFDNLPESKT